MTSRPRLMITLGIVAILLTAFVSFVVLPLHANIVKVGEAIEQEQLKGAIAELQQANAAASKREYERIQTQAGDLNSFFVSNQDLLGFIAAIEQAAQANAVDHQIDNLREPQKNEKTSSIQLKFRGPFAKLMNTLSSLEEISYYLPIDRLNMVVSTENPTTPFPVLDLTIQGTIHWL